MSRIRAVKALARRRWALLAVAGVVIGGAVAGVTMAGENGRSPDRQTEVAQLGATVMPFDLDSTTHVFTPARDGGTQVVADEPGDDTQIRLIREHLVKEAKMFARGDFGDPATIHGDEMPGLEELRATYTEIRVVYSRLPDGAKITYTSRDGAAIGALHDWFQAQTGDHGGHAESG